MIYGPDAGPIKVANEGNPGQAERVLRRHNTEKVGIILNGIDGIRVGVRNLLAAAVVVVVGCRF